MVALAVAGATGAVGGEILKVLERRNFPVEHLRLFASERSAEQKVRLKFRGEAYPVEALSGADLHGTDVLLMSAGSFPSRALAQKIAAQGCLVIDNSSAWRLDGAVPLVVPEINAAAAAQHKGIIANPNCTTAIALMALWPLHRAFSVEAVVAASYQAASGAGDAGLRELKAQHVYLEGQTSTGEWEPKMFSDVFPKPIALNVIPHIGAFNAEGYTDEEMKLVNEGRKIMGHAKLRASLRCVRVDVERVHSVAMTAQFKQPVTMEAAVQALKAMPGLLYLGGTQYPTPLEVAGKYDCQVGGLRRDLALENALSFFVCGDQLLKGAALNAVQIAELFVK